MVMPQLRVALFLCLVLAAAGARTVLAFPHSEGRGDGRSGGDVDYDREIVMVEEVFRYSDASTNSTAALITLDEPCSLEQDEEEDGQEQEPERQKKQEHTRNVDNEFVMGAVDDLIVPAKNRHEIDLLTSDEEESLTTSAEHEGDTAAPPMAAALMVDMSDFVALIPAAEVKSIATNYYRNDPEVQRAYAFLSGRDFAALQQHIMAVPEMAALLRYLNASGLDLVAFLRTLAKLTVPQDCPNEAASPAANEVEGDHLRPEVAGQAMQDTSGAATSGAASSTGTPPPEQLNGLHGLVDSILDVLPQDQILTTFFDKLESNEPFSRLVANIGSPAFAKILANMESSVPLRNLIFTLHNNGIYITRIVDSLKAYFFLGTF